MFDKIVSDKKNILIFVLLIAVLLLFDQSLAPNKQPAENRADTEKNREEVKKIYLDAFPKIFILDPEAADLFNEVKRTNEGITIVRGFNSRLSVEELTKRYRQFSLDQGWLKTFDSKTPAGVQLMNFSKELSRLGVSVNPRSDGTNLLVLTFVPKLSVFENPIEKEILRE
ncbi:MAG: hypothetical protein AAB585_00170 [Patescibacteria group bacterium]